MQISAKTNSLDRLTKKGTAHIVPVFLCIQCRISTLHKGRCSAKAYREQIWMKTDLMSLYRNSGAKTYFISVKYAFDQTVKSKFLKSFAVRLQAYPAVIIEYISFFTVFVCDVDQLFCDLNYKGIDELHPVLFSLISRHMGYVTVSLVHKILCCHGIAILFRKIIQSLITYRKVIGTPVCEKIAVSLIRAPDPYKIVEQRSETYYCGIRMSLTPVLHPVCQILSCFRISWIYLHQMLFVPIIRGMIVHRNLFPDTIRQKAYRICMERFDTGNGHYLCRFVVAPFFPGNFFIYSTVIYLPVFHGCICSIYLKLLIEKFFHDLYFQSVCGSNLGRSHQECLLKLILMCLCPLIVITDDTNCRIDSISGFQDIVRKHSSIAVTDYICSPFICHF